MFILCKHFVHHFVPNLMWELLVRLKTMFLSTKNWGLSWFTVYNIMKRFRESGEISVCKEQGRKPLLNVHDHRALRRYCLRNSHAAMMDIATWVREYVGKSLNAIRNCIMQKGRHKCKKQSLWWHGWSAHKLMSISAGQCWALILHELQQRGFVGIVGVCLTGLLAIQICDLLKIYGT